MDRTDGTDGTDTEFPIPRCPPRSNNRTRNYDSGLVTRGTATALTPSKLFMFVLFFFSNYGFIYLSAGWAHSAAHTIGGKEHIRYSGGVSSHL